ncbi:hypothetical protein AVEN_221181-1 [Araneus ventricosus]|uniref:Uncharacterized protein n=1 Tax=Araneus ventricosus TaxID=182803 RepID=A0A4Y2I3D4_ARAVE|nr:hypothetical protein AVEN_221181-1 [Araneus ventricosus]
MKQAIRHKNCRCQIVLFTAVAIETDYRRKNAFLVGRTSFKRVPPQTGGKNKKNSDFCWIPPIRNGSSLAQPVAIATAKSSQFGGDSSRGGQAIIKSV